ncbi:ABC transporter ATP-binding protein [Ornithinimicrobium cavernae]|uniref:ABC transporter ATP-binding protein n=1 Tax=Ornithinimicrobium cavernae TaxID=2666047 RepID=UPI000D68FB4F|nr:ABC transporter ATP-binding protein [Ornithinimicrobium cavernae]
MTLHSLTTDHAHAVEELPMDSPHETLVCVEDVAISYEGRSGRHVAVADASFTVRADEFVALVGPSGAGKTTLLRTIAGLHKPQSGRVLVNGEVADGPPRDVAVVFQDYSRSLLAWLTLRGNVMLPLRVQGLGRKEAARRADDALADVGLAGKGAWHPWQLSGGMQQRVAIARALACRPRLLLMDEPFASVDAQTRMDLEDLVLRIREDRDISILMVTHDIDEATYLADRVIVLSPPPARVARIVDVDLPSPRSQEETRATRRYVELRTTILELVRHRTEDSAQADR